MRLHGLDGLVFVVEVSLVREGRTGRQEDRLVRGVDDHEVQVACASARLAHRGLQVTPVLLGGHRGERRRNDLIRRTLSVEAELEVGAARAHVHVAVAVPPELQQLPRLGRIEAVPEVGGRDGRRVEERGVVERAHEVSALHRKRLGLLGDPGVTEHGGQPEPQNQQSDRHEGGEDSVDDG